jgi:hypothetical protein
MLSGVDKKNVMAHISLLINPFIKTKPVLKVKLAGDYNQMPLNSCT